MSPSNIPHPPESCNNCQYWKRQYQNAVKALEANHGEEEPHVKSRVHDNQDALMLIAKKLESIESFLSQSYRLQQEEINRQYMRDRLQELRDSRPT